MNANLTETPAHESDITIEHRPEESRFVLVKHPSEVIGFAHYTLLGDEGINFDSTVVRPDYRGTGLSAALVRHALGSDIVEHRSVVASCWYVADMLRDHPEALAKGARLGN